VSAERYPLPANPLSMGHPDKVADQIQRNAILDFCLTHDKMNGSRAKTLVTTDLAVVAGEITTGAALTRAAVDRWSAR